MSVDSQVKQRRHVGQATGEGFEQIPTEITAANTHTHKRQIRHLHTRLRDIVFFLLPYRVSSAFGNAPCGSLAMELSGRRRFLSAGNSSARNGNLSKSPFERVLDRCQPKPHEDFNKPNQGARKCGRLVQGLQLRHLGRGWKRREVHVDKRPRIHTHTHDHSSTPSLIAFRAHTEDVQ